MLKRVDTQVGFQLVVATVPTCVKPSPGICAMGMNCLNSVYCPYSSGLQATVARHHHYVLRLLKSHGLQATIVSATKQCSLSPYSSGLQATVVRHHSKIVGLIIAVVSSIQLSRHHSKVLDFSYCWGL